MAIVQFEFSDNQAITASAATTAATNIFDTEAASSNLGGGTPIWLVCRVNTAFTTASAGDTLTVDLESSATSGGTYVDVVKGAAYTVGQLVHGFDVLTVPLAVDHSRYLKVNYNYASGSGFTAGTINAYLTLNAPRNS